MSLDTPRKKNRRDKLVKRFSEDWEVDTSTGPTLRYKRKPGLFGLWQRFFGRKHSVFARYWYFKSEYLNNENIRKFYFPVKHDNMPVSGVPFKYELQGTWQIEDEDLTYLYGGPLIDQHAELLVPVDAGLKKAQRIAKQFAPIAVTFASLTTIATNWSTVLAIFRHVENAL